MTVTGYAPSLVVDGPDRAHVSDAVGGSEGVKLPNGNFSVSVQGSPLTGEGNEPTVMRVLADAMVIVEGVSPTINATPPNNAMGEDAVFTWPDRERVVQAVTIPSDPKYPTASVGV